MGERVHVVSKHESYGDSEAFNYQSENFADLLGQLGCYICGNEFDFDRFECEMCQYEVAMEVIKIIKDGEKSKEEIEKECDIDYDYVMGLIDVLGGIDYVYNSMNAFHDEAERGHNWITFCSY